jgi:hypothetical protein
MGRAAMVTFAVSALLVQMPGGAAAQEPQTLKERLSDKASDNQRVDNCRVPAERRGSVPRPDCQVEPHLPAAPAVEAGAGTPKAR